MNACPRCGSVDPSGRLSACPRCLLFGDTGQVTPLPVLGPDWLRVEEELGEGGMGRVYRCHDARLGRDVAVKVLRPEGAADPGFRARFAREARTLARLEHPGIVAVYDFGTTPEGEAYLVMQFVAGGSLAERLPMPPADAVAVARQLCDALAYAHRRGVVHRDIKPENVLLDDDDRAKLSDFGIARLMTPGAEEAPLTAASQVLGTPGYMAPEARAGAPPDPRMDVYAVGALLTHAVAGRFPDQDAGSGDRRTLGLPHALASVVARATAPDPAARTQSAEALGRELDAALVRLRGAPADPDDLPPEERTWRGAVALLAAVATAVAIYAALVSVTPRAMSIDDALPLTAFGDERLPDGRVLTRARFEVWPTLGAAIATALALGAYGMLLRHWRLTGLDRPAPGRPLAGARRMVSIGAALFALFVAREWLDRVGALGVAIYIPVLGGCLELVMLQWLWDAVLEAKRTARSLAREPLLWLGLVLALFPPVYHWAHLGGLFGR